MQASTHLPNKLAKGDHFQIKGNAARYLVVSEPKLEICFGCEAWKILVVRTDAQVKIEMPLSLAANRRISIEGL